MAFKSTQEAANNLRPRHAGRRTCLYISRSSRLTSLLLDQMYFMEHNKLTRDVWDVPAINSNSPRSKCYFTGMKPSMYTSYYFRTSMLALPWVSFHRYPELIIVKYVSSLFKNNIFGIITPWRPLERLRQSWWLWILSSVRHRIMWHSTHRHVGLLEEDVRLPAKDTYTAVFTENDLVLTQERTQLFRFCAEIYVTKIELVHSVFLLVSVVVLIFNWK